uniref:transmembrane protease serine 6-like n=1 Tax=Styela clava TaxID=7725 RepID=UPI001939BA37|nr:transmembrane protease serine 6-like [Styela clava]
MFKILDNGFIVGILAIVIVSQIHQVQGQLCHDRYPLQICQVYHQRRLCKYVEKSCRATCSGCSDVILDQGAMGWSEWTAFSLCSVTCGGRGVQTRTRICNSLNGCSGSSVSNRRCNTEKKCPSEWGPWGPYGSCSIPCGGQGLKYRVRTCPIPGTCIGLGTSQKACYGGICQRGQWTAWGPFQPCSVSCGGGKQNRYRSCRGAKTCPGFFEEVRSCAIDPCQKQAPATMTTTRSNVRSDSAGWSQCTRSCGTGTRFKFDKPSCTDVNNPECLRTFEECNIQNCPTETCAWNGLVPRYKSNGCCSRPTSGHCGQSFVSGRVINGDFSKNQQWPWMVSLRIKGLLCGGTLIDKQWIVTAAHCIKRGRVTAKLNEIEIRLGTNFWDRPYVSKHQASKIIVHPRHDYLQNDIAIIKLKSQVKLSSSVQPVCLPDGEDPPADSPCIAIGWGITDPKGPPNPANSLMEVQLNHLDINVCRKRYGRTRDIGNYVMNSNRLICAGMLTKRNDICEGDSGGPLLCQRRNSCAWYIAGIVSFGPKGTCGEIGSPAVFTKIVSFERWISRHISFPKAGGCKK